MAWFVTRLTLRLHLQLYKSLLTLLYGEPALSDREATFSGFSFASGFAFSFNEQAKRTKSPSPSSPLIQDSNGGGGTFFKMDVGNQTKSSPSHISSSASTNTTGNVTTPSMLKSISTILKYT